MRLYTEVLGHNLHLLQIMKGVCQILLSMHVLSYVSFSSDVQINYCFLRQLIIHALSHLHIRQYASQTKSYINVPICVAFVNINAFISPSFIAHEVRKDFEEACNALSPVHLIKTKKLARSRKAKSTYKTGLSLKALFQSSDQVINEIESVFSAISTVKIRGIRQN